jgi:hypothetical protein
VQQGAKIQYYLQILYINVLIVRNLVVYKVLISAIRKEEYFRISKECHNIARRDATSNKTASHWSRSLLINNKQLKSVFIEAVKATEAVNSITSIKITLRHSSCKVA